ncbi:NAD(P)/FAD-dependent oxidoreductase [Ktedonobacter racemifer]|uniref:NAD(P)/FAD-dependent oxidoreductase n=1 Tax=Ktedonobacter racemifer TaxID=363277 RepID=UPI0003157511|nr:NAD(P)/FAD-dependent oxidoreductase [Ktedonobacter racemifer]
MTSIADVFAAGDVADPYYRQAITAAADGVRAAMDVRRWLEQQQIEKRDPVPEIVGSVIEVTRMP